MRHSRGFTLIELVIAMILVAILAIVAFPRTASRDSLTIKGRADQLASDIRYAQSLSMTRGVRHCLALTPAAGPPYSGYTLMRNNVGTCDAAAEPAGFPLGTVMNLCDGTVNNCLTVPSANLPNDFVQFDGRGTPYSAAATPLGADAIINLAGDTGPVTITISSVTGRVLVQ